jgi:hypothetical protein
MMPRRYHSRPRLYCRSSPASSICRTCWGDDQPFAALNGSSPPCLVQERQAVPLSRARQWHRTRLMHCPGTALMSLGVHIRAFKQSSQYIKQPGVDFCCTKFTGAFGCEGLESIRRSRGQKLNMWQLQGWQMKKKASQTSGIDSGDKHDHADQHRTGS